MTNDQKPCVVIATHERIPITTLNIESLLKQSLVPDIVLVTSKHEELRYYREMFPQVQVILFPNQPLGAKWQTGIDFCRHKDLSFLVITGSDDILNKNFILRASEHVREGVPFIGLKQWYIYDPGKKKLYLFDYVTKDIPLGAGRVYSRNTLQKIGWRLFDVNKPKHLDNYGWSLVRYNKCRIVTDVHKDDMSILSVKGNWTALNPLAVHFNHPNTKLVKTLDETNRKDILNTMFNYPC